MKLIQLRSVASLSTLVLSLLLLIYVAVAIGWYALQQSSIELSGVVQNTVMQSINQRFDYVTYLFIALVILAAFLSVVACLMLTRGVLRPLKQIRQSFERIAAGDLTNRVEVTTRSEFGTLSVALKRLQDGLGRSVGSVRAGMRHIDEGTRQIVVGNTDLSSRTEQQAAALQQTAASMEQLASTVKQNADNALQANQLALTASEVAQRGGKAVGEVVATMQGISASSQKIADIVGVIDSIAFQTNILALNAAVEAARAGEQGRGFAVVASEVRALAQRSAHAAKEIKDLIDDSAKKVAEGSNQVERAGATMQEIVTSVARVTDIMGEISAASSEQSSGINQINLAVTQMDNVTQQNASLVEQASRSAAELREHVAYVSDAVSVFKLLDNQVIDVAATSITSSIKQSKSLVPPVQRQALPTATTAAESRSAFIQNSSCAALTAPRKRTTSETASAPVRASSRAVSGDDDWEEF